MIFSYAFLFYEVHTLACNYMAQFAPVAYRSWREQNVIQHLLSQSNLFLRPSPKGFHETASVGHPPPVFVTTSLHLESISTIKEQNMEFKAQFRFQQEWPDHRLSYDGKNLNYVRFTKDQMAAVWTPDTFFQNEKDGHYHMEDQPNFSFLVYKNGSIVYNRRLTMIFSCVMNFLKYPMDTQTCDIDFASYAYTTSDIVYIWKDRPLTIHHGAKSMLPNFVIRSFTNATCTSITNTGEYSCLKIVLSLQRDFSFFLLQAYMPSTTLVAVAWLSYWIDWQATAARFPLVLFTLLTMITQSHAISATLPPVSYTKAIDVWSGACIMFIFTSLIEYAFVNYQGIKDMKPKAFGCGNYSSQPDACHIWNKMIAWNKRKNRYLMETLHHLMGWSESMAGTRKRFGKRAKRPTCNFYDCRVEHIRSIDPSIQIDDFNRDPRNGYPIAIDHRSSIGRLSPTNIGIRRRIHTNNTYSTTGAHIKLQTRRRVDIMRLCHTLQARTRAERIDFMFRILHPVAFAMFNLVYWSVYCWLVPWPTFDSYRLRAFVSSFHRDTSSGPYTEVLTISQLV